MPTEESTGDRLQGASHLCALVSVDWQKYLEAEARSDWTGDDVWALLGYS